MSKTVEKLDTIFERREGTRRTYRFDVTRSALETSKKLFSPGTLFSATELHQALVEQAQFYSLPGLQELTISTVAMRMAKYAHEHSDELMMLPAEKFAWRVQ
jgi:hypothetical protein